MYRQNGEHFWTLLYSAAGDRGMMNWNDCGLVIQWHFQYQDCPDLDDGMMKQKEAVMA
jgi:hypothetical protein